MKAQATLATLVAIFWLNLSVALGAPLISIDAHDVDIADVIALLAADSGVNIVTDQSVKPEKITVHLHDVTFEEALQAIVSAHGLSVRNEGRILVVQSGNAVATGRQMSVVPLHHAQADDVARELAG
ncbi:MAG: hypothetical protein JO160_03650, partial [Candidatus Eremiobacteraeota bacterium]|nr:hypothetical protein [Candidatus Eremiobacteraeota bacterium]